MIDTHAHLDDPQFDADRDDVIARSLAAGVEGIVCVGTTLEVQPRGLRLAETYPQVCAAVGIHPQLLAEAAEDDWEQIVAMLDHPRVVALGETGLDRHWDFTPLDLQIEYFRRHLRLGCERNRPVIIHCRDAAADLIPLARPSRSVAAPRGVARLQRRCGDGRQMRGTRPLDQLCGQRHVYEQEVRAATGRGGRRSRRPHLAGDRLSLLNARAFSRQAVAERAGPGGAHCGRVGAASRRVNLNN